MSVQLQNRVISTEQMDRKEGPLPESDVDVSDRYGAIALKAWVVGAFLLIVSLPAGCLIALGMVNDIASRSPYVYLCFGFVGVACVVLWVAASFERARSIAVARHKAFAK